MKGIKQKNDTLIFTPLQACSDHGVVNGLEWARLQVKGELSLSQEFRDNEGEAVEIESNG